MLYAGAIVFFYGNLVSFLLEVLQKRVAVLRKDWFYILLHGLFGLANGLLFQNTIAALYGMGAALLYALLDRRIFRREGSILFIVLPLFCAGLLWGYLLLISDPQPPFTETEALEFASLGEGSITDHFPEREGKWEGEIKGYQVVKETSAEKIGREKFIITYNESWEKEGKSGSWFFSYEVGRQSMSAKGGRGEEPPYYKEMGRP
ncbi:GAF domain-containing protein [Bacillus infantis]|uniref:GAF domain-containing protein n=1 Tax=Bacillus infantis TaxID=324767 RepID=A0A5D4RRF8_9BACI|nr:GAF domain-containing protein [Bacillus infantis]TYS52112.1 GAF domain-containing protein [Bacillus infantis]